MSKSNWSRWARARNSFKTQEKNAHSQESHTSGAGQEIELEHVHELAQLQLQLQLVNDDCFPKSIRLLNICYAASRLDGPLLALGVLWHNTRSSNCRPSELSKCANCSPGHLLVALGPQNSQDPALHSNGPPCERPFGGTSPYRRQVERTKRRRFGGPSLSLSLALWR